MAVPQSGQTVQLHVTTPDIEKACQNGNRIIAQLYLQKPIPTRSPYLQAPTWTTFGRRPWWRRVVDRAVG